MVLKHFIVCMRDTHLRLIGPFDSSEALCDWACTPGKYGQGATGPSTNNPADDPRWQSIELEPSKVFPSGYLVEVRAPKEGPMPD